MELPDLAFTQDHYGVVVAGRVVDGKVISKPSELKALQAKVRAWAEKTGLPLAVVYSGTTINWNLETDVTEGNENLVIGLVTALAPYDDARHDGGTALERDALALAQLGRIPAGFWDALGVRFDIERSVHDPLEDCEDDDARRAWAARDYSGPGIYLVGAGWTWASICSVSKEPFDEDLLGEDEEPYPLAGDSLLTASADGTYTIKRVDLTALPADEPLLLHVGYC